MERLFEVENSMWVDGNCYLDIADHHKDVCLDQCTLERLYYHLYYSNHHWIQRLFRTPCICCQKRSFDSKSIINAIICKRKEPHKAGRLNF